MRPFARADTGLPLFDPADGWWKQSAGRFAHVPRPLPGAVLVLRATRRLPDGHVSVVRRVLNRREILVDHANWEPGLVDRTVPVLDVSPLNDWTLVRVWWRPNRARIRRIRWSSPPAISIRNQANASSSPGTSRRLVSVNSRAELTSTIA
jgi:hypothetical protein